VAVKLGNWRLAHHSSINHFDWHLNILKNYREERQKTSWKNDQRGKWGNSDDILLHECWCNTHVARRCWFFHASAFWNLCSGVCLYVRFLMARTVGKLSVNGTKTKKRTGHLRWPNRPKWCSSQNGKTQPEDTKFNAWNSQVQSTEGKWGSDWLEIKTQLLLLGMFVIYLSQKYFAEGNSVSKFTRVWMPNYSQTHWRKWISCNAAEDGFKCDQTNTRNLVFEYATQKDVKAFTTAKKLQVITGSKVSWTGNLTLNKQHVQGWNKL